MSNPTATNVLLVICDQLAADALACYGRTDGGLFPHINALARQGVRFRTAVTPCPLCGPARGPRGWGCRIGPEHSDASAGWAVACRQDPGGGSSSTAAWEVAPG